jgi:hypothetical protein
MKENILKVNEKIDKYKKYLTSHKVVKTSLLKIVRTESIYNDINDTVDRVNIIITHTYNFFKLYYLYCYNTKKQLPTINKKLMVCIMKTMCKFDTRGRKINKDTELIMKKLKKFYNKEFVNTINKDDKQLIFTGLSQIMEYEAGKIVTCLSNHLKNHFSDMLNRYINIKCDIKDFKDEKDALIFRKKLKKLKLDLLTNTDKCDKIFDKIKNKIRKNIMKNYNYKADPLTFLPLLIKMSIDGEKIMKKKVKKSDMFNIINCFPLRTNITKKYIDIDTVGLIFILMNKNNNEEKESVKKSLTKGEYRKNGNIIKYRDQIWKMYIRTNKSVFKKKGYKFNNMISTDGMACSIHFIRDDLYSKTTKVTVRTIKKPKGYTDDIYVDDLSEKQKEEIKDKKLIGIDPGIEDLIYCTDGNTKIKTKKNRRKVHKTDTYRYSQNQRRFTTKSKKYMKLIDNYKKDIKIGNKSVKEIESESSKYNSNTCIYNNFKEYLIVKNKINYELRSFYNGSIFGRLKWYSYMNRQRSDEEMVNGFKSKFGDSKDVVILMGDFDQRSHIKYKEPTKGKSIRTLFKKRGYKLYLVDEFRTSCKCFINGENAEKFLEKKNPKSYKKNNIICHGLLRSKIYTNKKADDKYVLLNRDFNGAMNILEKGSCIINNEDIPNYLTRTKNSVP